MRLVTSEHLLSLLNIGMSGGGTDAGTKALDATFPLIEEATDSLLVASSSSDTFNLPLNRADTVLRLSSGFLSTDIVTVRVAGDVSALPSTSYSVNAQEGTVLMHGTWGTPSSRGVVRLVVDFDHGFVDDDGDLQNAPQSLQMAHTFMAAAAMQISPAAMSKDKAKALGIDASRGFEYKARQILQGLQRPRAIVIWPVHTQR